MHPYSHLKIKNENKNGKRIKVVFYTKRMGRRQWNASKNRFMDETKTKSSDIKESVIAWWLPCFYAIEGACIEITMKLKASVS